MLFMDNEWFIGEHFYKILNSKGGSPTLLNVPLEIFKYVSLSNQAILYGLMKDFFSFCSLCTVLFLLPFFAFLFLLLFLPLLLGLFFLFNLFFR